MDFFQLLSDFSDWWRQNKRNPVRAGLAQQLDRLCKAVPTREQCVWNDQRVSQVLGLLGRLQRWKLSVRDLHQPGMTGTLLSWYSLKHQLLELLVHTKPSGLVIRITRSERRDAATISLRYRGNPEHWLHWPYDCMSAEVCQKIEAHKLR